MKAETAAIPPIIPQRLATHRSLTALAAILLAVGAVLAAKLSAGLNLAALQCGFLKTTGIPCPFCGGTRSFRAVADGQFWAAFLWNPLAFIGLCSAIAWGLLSLIQPKSLIALRPLERGAPQLIIAALVLNWIFVILRASAGWGQGNP